MTEGSAPRRASTRTSRAGEVQRAVKQLILERGLTAGDPLPTEFELVQELGISRNSLREALKALQAVGIVEIRHGFGMSVGRMSLGALVDELTFHGRMSHQAGQSDLAHLVEIRAVLERGLIEEIVDRVPDRIPAELDTVMDRMEAEARAGQVTPETDRRFHELLYEPLANPLVNRLLGAFWEVYAELRDDLRPVHQEASAVAARHRQIYDAVRARDRQAASDAMRRHFDGIRQRLRLPTDGAR